MAITIESNFSDYIPVYNPVIASVSSTNTGETNFKYVARVTVEGVSGTRDFEAKPDPDYDEGQFDLHNYLQTFVKANVGDPTSTSAFSYADSSIKKFSVDFYEKWDVAGVPTLDPDGLGAVASGDKYVFEGSFNYNEWLLWDYSTFVPNLTNLTNGQFLTTNKTPEVAIEDVGWSYYLTDSASDVNYVQIKTYDSTDTLIDTFEINNTLTLSGTAAKMCKVASAPESLNEVPAGTFATGTPPVITSSVAYYTFQLFDNTAAAVSELLTFTIQEPCRYTQYRLIYENKYGGFDGFNFTGRNTNMETMEKSSYKTDAYPVVSGGFNYLHRRQSNVTHYIKRTEKIKLQTRYLTTTEMNHLRELMYSPEIYLQFDKETGGQSSSQDLKAVHKIVGNTWEEKITEHDKLFKLNIEIELSHNAFSQRK